MVVHASDRRAEREAEEQRRAEAEAALQRRKAEKAAALPQVGGWGWWVGGSSN